MVQTLVSIMNTTRTVLFRMPALTALLVTSVSAGWRAWLLVLLAIAPPAYAQSRICRVPEFDERSQSARALDSRFGMDHGDPTLLVADNLGTRIVCVRFDRNGRQCSKVVAGRSAGFVQFSPDGTLAKGADINAAAVAHTSDGQVLFVDSHSKAWNSMPDCIRAIGQDGRITTVAGSSQAGSSEAGVPAVQAMLGWRLGGIVVNDRDEIYVADTTNNRIVKFTLGGNLEFVADTPTPGHLALTKEYLYITDVRHNEVRRMTLSDGEISVLEKGQSLFSARAVSATNRGERLIIADGDGNLEMPSLFSMLPEDVHATHIPLIRHGLQPGLPVERAHISAPMAILGADDSGILLAEGRGLMFVDRLDADSHPDAAQLRELKRLGHDAALRAGILALKTQAAAVPTEENRALRQAALDGYFRATRPNSFPPELVDIISGYADSAQTEIMLTFRARLYLCQLLSFPEFRAMPELSPGLVDRAASTAMAWYYGSKASETVIPSWVSWCLDQVRP